MAISEGKGKGETAERSKQIIIEGRMGEGEIPEVLSAILGK